MHIFLLSQLFLYTVLSLKDLLKESKKQGSCLREGGKKWLQNNFILRYKANNANMNLSNIEQKSIHVTNLV